MVIAAGRDDMLPVLTGVRIEIEGDDLAAGHRPLPLSPRELAGTRARPDESVAALVPAKMLADTAKSLTARQRGHHRAGRRRQRRGHHRLRGRGAGGVRRTTTRLLDGEFPKDRTLFPSEHQTVAIIETAALVEAVKRVALVAERNTPVRLTFSEGVLILEAGSGDDAQASESIEADHRRRGHLDRLQPAFLLDGLQAIDAPVVELSFTQAAKPACSAASRRDGVAGEAAASATC